MDHAYQRSLGGLFDRLDEDRCGTGNQDVQIQPGSATDERDLVHDYHATRARATPQGTTTQSTYKVSLYPEHPMINFLNVG